MPTRTAIENVFLGFESRNAAMFVDRRHGWRRWEALIEQSGFTLDPLALVGELRLADQQKVEILRALARQARVIVLDEPTASLARPDAELLLDVIRRLRDAGTTIVYVSHFLSEVLSIADDVTVLKDGRCVGTYAADDCDEHSLVSRMLGRSLEQTFPPRLPGPAREGSPALRVQRLSSRAGVQDVSLAVWPGEIVGIAGLAGSGKSELLHAIYGADRSSGSLELDGRAVRLRSPRDAVMHRLALIPENRKTQGLMLERSVEENLALGATRATGKPSFALDTKVRPGSRGAKGESRHLVDRLQFKCEGMSTPAGHLSGGNQQKLMFGRCLLQRPRVLLVDEPTRGVDIGAKLAIYELLVELAQQGMAVIVASSELEEILELSNRVVVMRGGAVTAQLEPDAITERNVMLAAFGTPT